MQNLAQTKSKSQFSKNLKSNIRNDNPNDRRDSNFNVDASKTCLEIPPNKTPGNNDEKNKKDKTSKIAAKISDSVSKTIATDDLTVKTVKTVKTAKKAQDAELNTYIRKTIRTTKLELDPRIIILQDRIAELEDRKKELKDKERALQSKISGLQEKQKQLENRNEELETWSTEIEMHNLDVLEKTAEIEDKERLAEEKLKKAEEISKDAHEKVKEAQEIRTEAHEKIKEAQEIRTEAEEKDAKNQQMELELNTKVKELNSKERAVKQRSRKIEERTHNLVKREQTEIELRLALEEKQRFLLAKESGLLGREEFVLMEETNLKEKEAEVQILTSEFEGRNSIITNKEKALKELEVSLRLSTTSSSNISSDNSLDSLGKTLENLSTYGIIDKNGKILVTGTGRCGTTFLMIIFTLLGLSTGFDKEKYHEAIFDNCNSGLEKYKITKHPKIFKNPQFLADIGDMTMNLKMIGCVIIPLRDYEAAAESRFRLGLGLANGLASDIPGGLWNATTVKEQIAYFNKIMANYVLQMVRWHIPTIFLDFDKMISSPEYLYNQLQPILNKISYDTFEVAYNKASDNQRKKFAEVLSPRT